MTRTITTVSDLLFQHTGLTCKINAYLVPPMVGSNARDLIGRCVNGNRNVDVRKGFASALKGTKTVDDVKNVLADYLRLGDQAWHPRQFLIFGIEGRTMRGNVLVIRP